jgi:hypothetical protein
VILAFEDIPQIVIQIYLFINFRNANPWADLSEEEQKAFQMRKGDMQCFDSDEDGGVDYGGGISVDMSDTPAFLIFAFVMTIAHLILTIAALRRQSRDLRVSLQSYLGFVFLNTHTGTMVKAYADQIDQGSFEGKLLNFTSGKEGISEENCHYLCNALSKQSQNELYKKEDCIENLYMADCKMSDSCTEVIAQWLESPDCRLKMLDVSQNTSMTGQSYLRLGQALSVNTSLEYIVLWKYMHPAEFDTIQKQHSSKRVVDMEERYAHLGSWFEKQRRLLQNQRGS